MPSAPIIVGFVDSAEGKAALAAGIAHARLVEAPLVVATSRRGGAALSVSEARELDGELDEVRGELARTGLTYDVRALVRGNDAAEDLVGLATELSAQLIVIGLRKRSPVGKLIMGSNAQQVLLDATCPVLAVKA